jgi:hypothetical protein
MTSTMEIRTAAVEAVAVVAEVIGVVMAAIAH